MPTIGRHMQKVPFARHFTMPKVSIFVSVFALAGVTLIFSTHAATPVNNSIEPENGSFSGNVTIGTDVAASGGSYASFFAAATTCPAGTTGTPPNCVVTGGGTGTASEGPGGSDTSCIFGSAPAGTAAAFCDGFNGAYDTGART